MANKKAAGAKAPGKRKPAAKKPAANKDQANTTGKAEDVAGVGNQAHVGSNRVPEAALIRRDPVTESGTKITASPEVQGDKTLMIIDVMQKTPVHVSLIEGVALTKGTDGRLIFVQGTVSNDLMPIANARSKFAVQKDGTCIYNARGFDDVPHGADFDLLDVVKLIEHNHGKKIKED